MRHLPLLLAFLASIVTRRSPIHRTARSLDPDGEGESGSGSGGDADGDDSEDGDGEDAFVPKAQLTKTVERERGKALREGRKAALAEERAKWSQAVGDRTPEDVAQLIEQIEAGQASESEEVQRLARKAAEADARAAAAETAAANIARDRLVERALFTAQVDGDAAEVARMLDIDDDDTPEDIADKVDDLKQRRPALFRTADPDTEQDPPPVVPPRSGRPAQQPKRHPNPKNDPGQRGRELARKRAERFRTRTADSKE